MENVSQSTPAAPEGGEWHAQFSPSSSARWLSCPASLVLHQNLPVGPASRYAAEGSAAHTLAARCFEYGRDAEFFRGEEIEHEGFVFTVDDDMIHAVQTYLDIVRRLVQPGDTFMFEQRVYFAEAIGVAEQGGTSDCIVLHDGCTRLTVGDYKHGMGERVDAENNTQLMIYAIGVLETFDTIMGDVQEVTLFICQPRIDNYSEWTCSRAELEALAERMRNAASRARGAAIEHEINGAIPLSFYGVSEKGCRWCSVKATCDAYRQKVAAAVFDDFEVLDEPAALEVRGKPQIPAAADKLGELYGALDLIEDWCRGVRAEVERRLFAGMTVIGPDGQPMKLIEGRKGHRAWSDADAAAATLVPLLGDGAYKEPELLSPSAVEKALGKKRKQEYEDFIKPLVRQPRGRATIALGSDPAPPYQAEAAVDEFDALPEAT